MTSPFQSRWQNLRQLPDHPEVSIFPDRAPRVSPRDLVDSDIEPACPACGYSLRGIEARHCPECGLHVEFEPVSVFRAAEHAIVVAAAMLMDQHQITNMIVTPEALDALLGMLARSKRMPHLLVPHKFLFEAVELLEARFGRRFFAPGERPLGRPPVGSWSCAACGEQNPITFEICWQCSTPAPADTQTNGIQ